MRFLVLLIAGLGSAYGQDWALLNFAQRLVVEVSNASANAVETLAVVPVADAAPIAPRFPGSLAIAVANGVAIPSQADDLDGDGNPDEFVFPVKLAAGETRMVHIYYSTTLSDSIPWPKRVHASHAYGYNHATVALESEAIGYRTYGGFFLDIQSRRDGHPGLNNSLVGYFGAGAAATIGRDVIHLGDTLGLGGLFLRAGSEVFRPPVNTPDYAHKPENPQAPHYRVIADGPVRAVVESRIDGWKVGADLVDIRALYSIAAGSGNVECRYSIAPVRVSREYEAGAGIRQLPQMKTSHAAGRLSLSGVQAANIGPIGLALYYDPASAVPAAVLATGKDANEVVVFNEKLRPGVAVSGRYWVAGAWSGSGAGDLLRYLAAEEGRARATVKIGALRFTKTPKPERVEGEAP
jgi:hypothetical protein